MADNGIRAFGDEFVLLSEGELEGEVTTQCVETQHSEVRASIYQRGAANEQG